MANALYYGDNLAVLRDSIPTESVDLIYLDPPFNSNASYNVLFKAPSGEQSQAQIEAFEDTWHWNESAERAFDEVVTGPHSDASIMLKAMRSALSENDMMAYLAMMAVRLIELHRVLKSTGSLFLHCDPTVSHYLKTLLDATFGATRFVNEVIWKRTSSKSDYSQGARHLPRLHDTILYYRKGDEATFVPIFSEHDPEYVRQKYPHADEDGRRYGLWDMTGPGGAAKGNPQYEVMGVVRFWRYSKKRMDEMIAAGRVIQPRPGAVPREKRYLDESGGVAIGDVWTDIWHYGARESRARAIPHAQRANAGNGTRSCVRSSIRNWRHEGAAPANLDSRANLGGQATTSPLWIFRRLQESSTRRI